MPIIVITGTNTDVGKTIATAALATNLHKHGKKVHVIKPAQTGEPDGHGDRYTVEKLLGEPITTSEYARYPEPLAPNLSARRAGMPQLDLNDVATRIRTADSPDTFVLVEGAGGLLVRIADDWTICDLAHELEAPLIVVTSTQLGSLNLAELTVKTAERKGVRTLGLIGGSLPQHPDLATELNVTELPVVTGVPLLGCLPEGAGKLSPEEFAAACPLEVTPLLDLG
ncbi:dethiobiotin synthase [Corynebacterium aquilae]|uniref:ATP-dependent dethiobiotin synthetase BioD n=1 Tax=Corynebacterium aquilae DSM 44791 TaxID=1431546 RepID=A0A1L7CFV3_9CORY|nr:dethiobiotin synthase [Corynebacterium aquilae]APT84706.1 dethiobiotin synthetase [Corynebacterium aquilae DSM 44791]